jgi:cell wall assembly regulator SMI1
MQDIWNRIESWLEVNAPEIHSDLLVGATDEEIFSAEELMDIRFPDDVKVSYRIHNGQLGDSSPLLGEWQLYSLENIKSRWKVLKNLFEAGKLNAEATPIGPVRAEWWNPKWIPIAHNGAGDLYCLDLVPAAGGQVGQIISFWHMDEKRERLANSFQEWLQKYA